jgi:hypothetical protein
MGEGAHMPPRVDGRCHTPPIGKTADTQVLPIWGNELVTARKTFGRKALGALSAWQQRCAARHVVAIMRKNCR